MKVFLIALAVLVTVSCTQSTTSKLCTYTADGLLLADNAIVKALGTCNATKMTNKILDVIKCPEITPKSSVTAIISLVCPEVVSVLTSLTSSELQSMDCDPKIISTKLSGLCSLIK